MKNRNKKLYPNITKLGVKIYNEPMNHIFWDDLYKCLEKNKLNKEIFNEYFGIQTCPIIKGKSGIYAWDAEAVLERMKTGKLTGTQLSWD